MSVEKFTIRKAAVSYTTIPNKVIQGLKNYEALGLYAYLSSLPEGWVFYKKQLAEHANIGRDRLNKNLKILHAHNLIEYAQIRNEKGRFAHYDLHVKDGTSFKNIDLQKCATPFTEKPLTENRLPANRSYKRNIDKINKDKKEKDKSLRASSDAPPQKPVSSFDDNLAKESFERFWINYKRKKDKARAFEIWVKQRLWEKEDYIMGKLLEQNAKDYQYQTMQFIPYPVTYLRNQRYEDEITAAKEHPVTSAIRELKESARQSQDFKNFLN